ncbi:hypothetical protein HNV10_03450 [Winogradskyella litoriviva]|uniref:Type II toxin-antitoxin system RelE/ParE family toxin n=1 Tax=Winogradskyella litoriviva TaxID=1220182 RepID=A0ABX2E2S7_9FLAO|nr:hypothetical protein [Winogradskyella litoriviva]NRD22281.1 hypothetical protein [Winogradskyella litoriviva]
MEKVTVYYRPQVTTYINELVYSLYKRDYFGFMEDAIIYKDKLIDFIENNISNFPYKNTPLALAHFGSNYIFYNSTKRTTWYIFFERSDSDFLVTYISNNHHPISEFLK